MLIGLTRRSIQGHLQVSKNGSFRVRALRCLIVHDILRKYFIDLSRATRGLESCARGNRASLNGNQGATMALAQRVLAYVQHVGESSAQEGVSATERQRPSACQSR